MRQYYVIRDEYNTYMGRKPRIKMLLFNTYYDILIICYNICNIFNLKSYQEHIGKILNRT